jgi:long-chain acyl-CoA synthetase
MSTATGAGGGTPDPATPGSPRTIDYPDVPVGAVLAGSARRFTDHVAYWYRGIPLTYDQLWRRACRFANALRRAGIGPGNVVAVHLPNCPQYPVAYYGILLAGATFTPCNPLLPSDDLAFQLADSGAVAIVSWLPSAPALAAAQPRSHVRLVVLTGPEQSTDPAARLDPTVLHPDTVDFEAILAGQSDEPPRVAFDPATTLAHLAYTGGTTGRSKGVELPHRNVVTNTLQAACHASGSRPVVDEHGGLYLEQYGDPTEYPVRLGTNIAINLVPWFHVMGIVGYLNVALLTGSTTIIHERFDPVAYLADAAKYQVTSIGGAPPIFVALMQTPEFETTDLSSVRRFASGAAPLSTAILEALRARFPDAVVGEGYGLTEVTMGATANPVHRSGIRKVGTVGLPIPDTEIKVVTDEGVALPSGEAGEVCIRGPQVMRGYHNRPEETAAVLDADGWLRTGDIGIIDADGYLSIVDRKKDMLLYKGYNVYPRDLEEILQRHPGVAQAAVVGRPDLSAGELPVAFVVRRAGSEVTGPELQGFVSERVVPYKRVREVHFVDTLPVSAAGKILRRELRRSLGTE